MEALLSIVIILASILLIFVVFVQNPKGGGVNSQFGTSQQLGGVKKANDFIEKATWTLAGTILVVSIVLSGLTQPKKIKQNEPAPKEQGNKPK